MQGLFSEQPDKNADAVLTFRNHCRYYMCYPGGPAMLHGLSLGDPVRLTRPLNPIPNNATKGAGVVCVCVCVCVCA